MESVRVDVWLWSVRLCPTRSAATEACRGGHVRVNDRPAKPATDVKVGDRVHARLAGRDREVEVTRLIAKRVGAPVAVGCYLDHSPPPPPRDDTVPWLRRDPGAGRPTKRDRRAIDRFHRGR